MEFLQEVLRGIHRLDDAKQQSDDIDVAPEIGGPIELDDDPEFDLDGVDDPDEIEGEDMPTDDEFNLDDNSLEGEDEFGPPEDIPGVDLGGSGGAGGGDIGGAPDETVGVDAGDEDELGDVAHQAVEDPDRQGVIRTVKNAHLVYKRESGDGGFEELWVYNVGTLKDELEVRKAILAGTDIPPNRTSSEDGSQTYTIWSAGNAELIHITGLPN